MSDPIIDPNTPPATPEAPATPPEPPHMVAQDQVDRIVQERLNRERQKFADYDDLKQKATRFDEMEAASLSDLEKANSRADAAEKSAADATALAKETNVRSAVISAAVKAGAVNADAVFKLIERDAVTVGDDGSVTGAEEAVAALLESDPYLVGKASPPVAAADGGPRGSGTGTKQLTRDDLSSMTPDAIDAARISGQLDQLLGRQ